MARLSVPSLQHLARNWRSDPLLVKKILVGLAKNSPTFSYGAIFVAVRDMLALGMSYEQVRKGIIAGVKRPDVLKNFLELLPLINHYFKGTSPDFVQSVGRRYYPVSRDLMVPFEPPLVYGLGGSLHFPWLSLWRSNPLSGEQLSLFVTIVDELLLQDPDLEAASFEILDFSVQKPKGPRELKVINARDIPRVSEKTKREMLEIYAEGYALAQKELAGHKEEKRRDDRIDKDTGDQPGLFDGK